MRGTLNGKPCDFTVIVPTIGRPSLRATLDSLARGGIGPRDEVIVVGDGVQPEARELLLVSMLPHAEPYPVSFSPAVLLHGYTTWYMETAHTGHWGNEQRELAPYWASGRWLLFLDDDDEANEGVYDELRAALADAEEVPHVCQMRLPTGTVVPKDKASSLTVGQVGTPCIVVPGNTDGLGEWGPQYPGDHRFLVETVQKYDGEWEFLPIVIADIRRQSLGR